MQKILEAIKEANRTELNKLILENFYKLINDNYGVRVVSQTFLIF